MSFWRSPFATGGRLAFAAGGYRTSDTRFELPRMTDKDKAIQTARQVLKYEQAGITITPSETIILAREYLKALHLPERQS